MKLFVEMPDRHYNNIKSLAAVSLGRIPYKGIIMYAINAIKHGKVLEQEPRWIPVSERLPEKNVWVLVTVEKSGNRYQEIMRRNMYIESWTDGVDIYTDEIIAWMPLPKPYEPQESEDKE